MLHSLSKSEAIESAKHAFNDLTTFVMPLPEPALFERLSADQWSIAENLEHLNISLNQTTLALRLPKVLIRFVGRGLAKKDSRDYETLVREYKNRLAAGGRASGKYIPVETGDRHTLLTAWQTETQRFLDALQAKWTEESLDRYQVPHPLLGRITVRELCYFTIYHTYHHLQIMKDRLNTVV